MQPGQALVGYEEIHEDGYEELVAKSFSSEFVPSADSPSDVYVAGPCPRCRQPMTFRYPILIFRGVEEASDVAAEALWQVMRERGAPVPTGWSFTAYCMCKAKHPNAPDDASGCGAFWGMTVNRPSSGDQP